MRHQVGAVHACVLRDGRSGGVMIYFDRIEVVNILSPEYGGTR